MKKQRNNDVVTCMTYSDWEDVHYQMVSKRRQRAAKDREKRAIYYRQQRLLGLMVLAVAAVFVIIGCILNVKMVQYVGILISIIGIYVVLTPHMVLVNTYYLERKDRLNEY